MSEVVRAALGWAGWAALGAAFGAAYLPGSALAWAPWFALAPLYHAAWRLPPGAAFARGWLFGAAAWAAGMVWLPPTVALFLGVSPAAAVLLTLAASAACGLGFALLAAVSACVPPGRGVWRAWLTAAGGAVCLDAWFPALWEWSLGTGQVAYPVLAQAAAFGGAPLLAWLIAGVGAGLAAACSPAAGAPRLAAGAPRARPLLLTLAVLGLTSGAGALRLAALESAERSGAALRVILLQGDLPPRVVEPEANVGDLPGYAALTAAALAEGPADLVVWPESAFPGRVALEPSGAWAGERALGDVLAGHLPPGPPVLMGAITERAGAGGRRRRFNTALSVDEHRNLVDWVDKAHLIPFGEFMPGGPAARWLRRLSPRTWRLGRGRGPGVVAGPSGSALGVLICYEDMVPARARRMARAGAALLVNITNDAWFTPPAREAHFLFSRLRAVETGLPFVRAANGGVTAYVDAAGRVRARLPSAGAGRLAVDVVPRTAPAPGVRLGGRLSLVGALALALGLLPFLDRAGGRG